MRRFKRNAPNPHETKTLDNPHEKKHSTKLGKPNLYSALGSLPCLLFCGYLASSALDVREQRHKSICVYMPSSVYDVFIRQPLLKRGDQLWRWNVLTEERSLKVRMDGEKYDHHYLCIYVYMSTFSRCSYGGQTGATASSPTTGPKCNGLPMEKCFCLPSGASDGTCIPNSTQRFKARMVSASLCP